MQVTLTMPFPPPQHALYNRGAKGRRYNSKRYLTWQAATKAALADVILPKFTGRVEILIEVGLPRNKDGSITNRDTDCTNYSKAPEDMLVELGVISDDCWRYVWRVTEQWSDQHTSCIVTVREIKEIKMQDKTPRYSNEDNLGPSSVGEMPTYEEMMEAQEAAEDDGLPL